MYNIGHNISNSCVSNNVLFCTFVDKHKCMILITDHGNYFENYND